MAQRSSGVAYRVYGKAIPISYAKQKSGRSVEEAFVTISEAKSCDEEE